MDFYDIKMMARMGADKNVRKFIFDIYDTLKEDKDFSAFKYMKMMMNMAKGEKIVKFEDSYIISTFLPPFPSKAFMTNVMAVDEPKKIFTKQMNARRTAPISIYLCVTDKCPNNCVYCSSKNRTVSGELSTKEWADAISGLQDMNTSVIGITGGEPMARDDIFDIVKSIDDRSSSILFTSGYNLTEEKAKRLKECGLFGIGISLDSKDREEHNANRRNDKAFDYALEAMKNSRKAGLYTMAQSVVTKDNVNEDKLFGLFKLARESGAHEVKVLEPILSGSLLKRMDVSDIMYDKPTRKKLVEIQHKANRMGVFPKITTFAYTESREKFGCGAGTQHSYISATGELYPCDFVPMNFGSVKDKEVRLLWKSMNKAVGNPKISCFAQKVNRRVYLESEGKLPLGRAASVRICMKNRCTELPEYYNSVK